MMRKLAQAICSNALLKMQIALSLVMAFFLTAAGYRTFRQDHCEICGESRFYVRLAVHHIVMQSVDKRLRDVRKNCVTLCDPLICRKNGCHWLAGHGGKSWSFDNSAAVCRIFGVTTNEIYEAYWKELNNKRGDKGNE